MKRFNLCLVLIFATLLVSCTQDASINDTSEPSRLADSKTSTSIENSNEISPESWSNVEGNLEQSMEWASFITTKICKNHPASRNALTSLLSNGNKTIRLSTLLSSSSTEHGLQEFNTAFRDYLTYYYNCCPEPDEEPDKPGFPPGPPPPPGENTTITQDYVEAYIQFVLIDNCVELYFPKGLDFSGNITMTSAAHPLNTDNYNIGIVRYFNAGLQNQLEVYQYETRSVILDRAYVIQNKNIVIARPYRGNTKNTCSYLDYEGIDFTQFPFL